MRNILLASASCGLLVACPANHAFAQDIGSTAPAVRGDDPEFEAMDTDLRLFRLSAGGEARIEYDDNVFAEPGPETSDAIFRVIPYAELSREGGRFTARLRGSMDIRRYASETTEDAEAARVALRTRLDLGQGGALATNASWERVVEDRGDPEARSQLGIGPRLYDVLSGGVGYNRQGARLLLNVEANAQKVDAMSAIDADRDYSSVFGQAGIGYRPAGSLYFTATAFANRRDFRLEEIVPGIDRDTATYGGRLGVQFADGGLIEGRLAAGVFRLEFDGPALESRTGFSLDGELTYRPTQRSAISFDLFNGDVASFRGGASARTDTRVGVRYEQEIRHNLLANLTAGYQQSDFFGSDIKEQTLRVGGGVEYLVSRNFSITASARLADRDSDLNSEDFGRFNAGLGVRFRF